MKLDFRKRELLRKYLENESSRAEFEELFEHLKYGNDDSYETVMEELWGKIANEKALEEKKSAHLLQHITRTRRYDRLRRFKRYQMAAAILVVLVMTGGLFLYRNRKKQVAPARIVSEVPKPDIKPGGVRAILLADSVQVALDKKDTTFMLAGNRVRVNGGHLSVADAKPVKYTLWVPRGGEYSLTLADGTQVWLNADSKLIYPVVFSGDTREVNLEGEAYFKVAKNANQPFIVHTNEQEIKVLGTNFNVHAYEEEEACVTTLVNGKVCVHSFGKKVVLKPGQQVKSEKAGEVRLQRDADVSQVIAWKNGYFIFKNAGLHDIMWRLSRWYNVQVKYENKAELAQFTAIVSRDNNISQILNMLEATGSVDFKIEGNVVTVLPPSNAQGGDVE